MSTVRTIKRIRILTGSANDKLESNVNTFLQDYEANDILDIIWTEKGVMIVFQERLSSPDYGKPQFKTM